MTLPSCGSKVLLRDGAGAHTGNPCWASPPCTELNLSLQELPGSVEGRSMGVTQEGRSGTKISLLFRGLNQHKTHPHPPNSDDDVQGLSLQKHRATCCPASQNSRGTTWPQPHPSKGSQELQLLLPGSSWSQELGHAARGSVEAPELPPSPALCAPARLKALLVQELARPINLMRFCSQGPLSAKKGTVLQSEAPVSPKAKGIWQSKARGKSRHEKQQGQSLLLLFTNQQENRAPPSEARRGT